MRGCAVALAAPLAVERRVGMASCRSRAVFGVKLWESVCFQRGFVAAWANWFGQNTALPFAGESEADGR